MEWIKGYKPQQVEDGYKNLVGGYFGEVTRAAHIVSPDYDFYSISVEVKETREGDEGVGRKLDVTFNPNEKSMQRLADTLFTMGIDINVNTQEEFDKLLEQAVGKQVFIRCWEHADDSTGKVYWNKKIVKELRAKKGAKKVEAPKTEVPF